MLTNAQIKLIKSLHKNKGREESGLCLVEGAKTIEAAANAIEYVFERDEVENFDELVTTETPQDVAAVARIPRWSSEQLAKSPTLVVLDGVQDPGNVGAALRLCLGFNASLLLVECADVTSPKVVRASAGTMFQVPWVRMTPAEAENFLAESGREIFRLEKRDGSLVPEDLRGSGQIALIAGSEGAGIRLKVAGRSVAIPHDARLESLNVTHALAIALYVRGLV